MNNSSDVFQFGKYQNQKYTILLDPDNYDYAFWILEQGSSFPFQGARTFVKDNFQFNTLPCTKRPESDPVVRVCNEPVCLG